MTSRPALRWSSGALADLDRLHDFLAPANPKAAARVIQTLVRAALRLRDHPHIGARLDGFPARDVRRCIVGAYELRYEVTGDQVLITGCWHSREKR